MRRQRRSAEVDGKGNDERIVFESHGRLFDLRLRRSTTEHQFATRDVEVGQKRPALDSLVRFYMGYVADEPYDSYASGTIIDGIFYGTIRTRDRHKYFVEAARKYNHTLNAHSIAYRERDINLNSAMIKQFKRDVERMKKRLGETSKSKHDASSDDVGCASDNSKIKDWMQKEQEALYNERIRTMVSLNSSS